MRSILGNFGYTSLNVKEIEEEIKNEYSNNPSKNSFTLEEVIELITKKWFNGGKEAEANEIFKLFDKKYLYIIYYIYIKNYKRKIFYASFKFVKFLNKTYISSF